MKKTDQKITFRVDASMQIGTGHFMRCLTLAIALKKHTAQIRFISRHLPTHLRDMLTAQGFDFILLDHNASTSPTDELAHAHWLETSQSQDAQATIGALSDETWDWLIVDHYSLDFRWESKLRKSVKKILVIDDIADRTHDCDVLLDQNFYADMDSRYKGKVPPHCQLLLGPRYVLLREEFRQLHQQIKPRSSRVNRLLVFFGGVDTDNYTGRAIEALSLLDMPDLQTDVVVGAQHSCLEQIKIACTQHGFICHVQTERMAELMAASNLAIAAGGTATWERCCLGLPTLTICTAFNQQEQIADAAKEGLLYAPSLTTDWTAGVKNHITALIENDHLRWFLSSRSMQAVDGRGALRIVNIVTGSGIETRKVSSYDCKNLFTWRNHPTIRSVSRNTEPITWEDHQKWFTGLMGSKNRVLLIGHHDDVPVGVIRFDKQKDGAEVSIYLVPDANHSGQGRNLLLSGEQWIRKNRPEIKLFSASVLGGNERSHRLFLKAGYQVESTHYLKKL